MQSIITITTPAASYDVTTLAAVKSELGVIDGANDVVLKRYVSGASQAAMQYCNRVFSVEAVSEQFVPDRSIRLFIGGVKPLQLSRWPLITVTSVTENSVLLVAGTDYLVNAALGQLTRLDGFGNPRLWPPLPLTIVYTAGYTSIPADLEDAVIRMVTKRFAAKGRDPSLKQETIPGVLERQFWIATGADAGNLTPDISDILDNYRVAVLAA